VTKYAVITSAYNTGPLMYRIIAFDDDPDEALRMARETRAELRERLKKEGISWEQTFGLKLR